MFQQTAVPQWAEGEWHDQQRGQRRQSVWPLVEQKVSISFWDVQKFWFWFLPSQDQPRVTFVQAPLPTLWPAPKQKVGWVPSPRIWFLEQGPAVRCKTNLWRKRLSALHCKIQQSSLVTGFTNCWEWTRRDKYQETYRLLDHPLCVSLWLQQARGNPATAKATAGLKPSQIRLCAKVGWHWGPSEPTNSVLSCGSIEQM